MKKSLIILLVTLLMLPLASQAESTTVVNQEMTIPFSFGDRTGTYTGELVNGKPEGYGCFRSQNDDGDVWIYLGMFSDDDFNGAGETLWASGKYEKGIYKDGRLTSATSKDAAGSNIVQGRTASPKARSSEATQGEQNALKSAQRYLDIMAFSHTGLIEQLEYEGYSNSEATYGADNCGADWNEQAAKAAAQYLDIMPFSRSGLIDQLKYDGFTSSQAEYGASQNGY